MTQAIELQPDELENIITTAVSRALSEASTDEYVERIHPDAEYLRPKQFCRVFNCGDSSRLKLEERGLITPHRLSRRFTLYEKREVMQLLEKIRSGEIVMPLDGGE